LVISEPKRKNDILSRRLASRASRASRASSATNEISYLEKFNTKVTFKKYYSILKYYITKLSEPYKVTCTIRNCMICASGIENTH
jgi:hypothetical protein